MNEFQLEIVTPDGLLFEGPAKKLIVRTTEGDVGILPHHSDYLTSLSIGVAKVFTEDKVRIASCADGLLSVSEGRVRLVAATFEWAEDIDVERAKNAKERAEQKLKETESDYESRLARVKLKRARARISASENK